MKDLNQNINNVVTWLKDYTRNANRASLVIGVSGGVDSALVSTLCAMTGITTVCVKLPCNTRPNETDRGSKHIAWLKSLYPNVIEASIDLSQTFKSFSESLPLEFVGGPSRDLAFANAKSRLRMVALYQVATIYEGLVVGTGNKVEDFGVGFFTKYGDGGVDISPIADFTKTDVREACKILWVLPELTNAIPTDGLWDDGRSDEDALGATYKELEWAMEWIEDGKDCYSTVLVEGLTERQKKVLKIYNKWHKVTAHKLLPIPTYKCV